MGLGKPPRLARIFQIYDPTVYFVTLYSLRRRNCLANADVHLALIKYGNEGVRRGIALGRYVIMPDHIHLFVGGGFEFNLGIWVSGLKRVVAAAVSSGRGRNNAKDAKRPATTNVAARTDIVPARIWQRAFFDHVLRNAESYGQKWNYVHDNPVRAGLVEKAEDRPYAGAIVEIDRV